MSPLHSAVATLALQEQWTLEDLQRQRRPVEEELKTCSDQLASQERALAATADQLARLFRARTFNPAMADLARLQWARQAQNVRETEGSLAQLKRDASVLDAAAAVAQHRLRLMEDEVARLRRKEAGAREASEAALIDDMWLQQHWGLRHGC